MTKITQLFREEWKLNTTSKKQAEKPESKHRKVGIYMYKFRNNPFGRRVYFKAPESTINDDSGDIGSGGGGAGGETGAESLGLDGESGKLSYEELLEQLATAQANEAKANAEKERFKNSVDDLTKKNKNLTEQVRNKMTADEQLAAAKAEAEEARKEADAEKDAKIKELETKFLKMDYSKRFMGVGMDEKTAEGMAELTGELSDPEKFFSELGKYIKSATAAAGENAVQELLKNRTDIKAGTGNGGKQSLAVEKAMELSQTARGNINSDALKMFM